MISLSLFGELNDRFVREGYQLVLVGGSVRDMSLGREPKDFDFATDALPSRIKGILLGWADAVWDVGERFGTIAARKDGLDVEITTFRTDGPGRKPEVTFTTSLVEDLKRRDFTINAMAMNLTNFELIDPFDGAIHLKDKIIDTPRDPALSFGDDPLRMLRAARFVSQLSFTPSDRVRWAMRFMAPRIDEISQERIAVELDKTLMGESPYIGLRLMLATGLLDRVLPGVTWESVFSTNSIPSDFDVETRWAKLLCRVDSLKVDQQLRRLKFSNQRVQTVTNLVAWFQQWDEVDWRDDATDAEVRQVLARTGKDLDRLIQLFVHGDELSRRADDLVDAEGFPTPPLSGKEIMAALGIAPGLAVGKVFQHLWSRTLSNGPMTKDQAVVEARRVPIV